MRIRRIRGQRVRWLWGRIEGPNTEMLRGIPQGPRGPLRLSLQRIHDARAIEVYLSRSLNGTMKMPFLAGTGTNMTQFLTQILPFPASSRKEVVPEENPKHRLGSERRLILFLQRGLFEVDQSAKGNPLFLECKPPMTLRKCVGEGS